MPVITSTKLSCHSHGWAFPFPTYLQHHGHQPSVAPSRSYGGSCHAICIASAVSQSSALRLLVAEATQSESPNPIRKSSSDPGHTAKRLSPGQMRTFDSRRNNDMGEFSPTVFPGLVAIKCHSLCVAEHNHTAQTGHPGWCVGDPRAMNRQSSSWQCGTASPRSPGYIHSGMGTRPVLVLDTRSTIARSVARQTVATTS